MYLFIIAKVTSEISDGCLYIIEYISVEVLLQLLKPLNHQNKTYICHKNVVANSEKKSTIHLKMYWVLNDDSWHICHALFYALNPYLGYLTFG